MLSWRPHHSVPLLQPPLPLSAPIAPGIAPPHFPDGPREPGAGKASSQVEGNPSHPTMEIPVLRVIEHRPEASTDFRWLVLSSQLPASLGLGSRFPGLGRDASVGRLRLATPAPCLRGSGRGRGVNYARSLEAACPPVSREEASGVGSPGVRPERLGEGPSLPSQLVAEE